LEVGAAGGEGCPAGAVALASGRACWHVILRTCRPSRVLLPFYICDAVVQPLAATRTPIEFYPLPQAFLPTGERQPAAVKLMLIVNYFGVQSPAVEARSRADA